MSKIMDVDDLIEKLRGWRYREIQKASGALGPNQEAEAEAERVCCRSRLARAKQSGRLA